MPGVTRITITALLVSAWLVTAWVLPASADDGEQLLSIDHFVPHIATTPAVAGQPIQLYVRERVQAATAMRSPSFVHKVVLFVHGAAVPSEVAFDVPYQDYSWMAYLSQAGFDVFGMDLTGLGSSTRPAPMDDPCNLPPEQQALLIPSVLTDVCAPSYSSQLATFSADWVDIDQVVDYLRAVRHVERVNLVGWSLGGPRAGGYAALHPEKIEKLVLVAPAYNRSVPTEPPTQLPEPGYAMDIATRQGFDGGWDSQVQCDDQFDPGVRDVLWTNLLGSDPVGAAWGPGVRRAPRWSGWPKGVTWGWNAERAAKVQAPTLLIAGELDQVVPEQDVQDLYADLRIDQKVFAVMACTSHFALWETRHIALFQASLEWLQDGSVNHIRRGAIRLGD